MSSPWRSACLRQRNPAEAVGAVPAEPGVQHQQPIGLGDLVGADAGDVVAVLPVEPERAEQVLRPGPDERNPHAQTQVRLVGGQGLAAGRAGFREVRLAVGVVGLELDHRAVERRAVEAGQRRREGPLDEAERAVDRAGAEQVQLFVQPEPVVGGHPGREGPGPVEPRAPVVDRAEARQRGRGDLHRQVRGGEGVGRRFDHRLDAAAEDVAPEQHAALERGDPHRPLRGHRREQVRRQDLLVVGAADDRHAVDEALDHLDHDDAVLDGLRRQRRLREHEAAGAIGRPDRLGHRVKRAERDLGPDQVRPDRREVARGQGGRALDRDAAQHEARSVARAARAVSARERRSGAVTSGARRCGSSGRKSAGDCARAAGAAAISAAAASAASRAIRSSLPERWSTRRIPAPSRARTPPAAWPARSDHCNRPRPRPARRAPRQARPTPG